MKRFDRYPLSIPFLYRRNLHTVFHYIKTTPEFPPGSGSSLLSYGLQQQTFYRILIHVVQIHLDILPCI